MNISEYRAHARVVYAFGCMLFSSGGLALCILFGFTFVVTTKQKGLIQTLPMYYVCQCTRICTVVTKREP